MLRRGEIAASQRKYVSNEIFLIMIYCGCQKYAIISTNLFNFLQSNKHFIVISP